MVTGGSSGIGLSTVSRLAEEGFRVAFFGQTPDHVSAAAEMLISKFGRDAIFHKCLDIHDHSALDGFFDAVRDQWGPPDTLICNAGISPKNQDGRASSLIDTSIVEWERVLATNLTAPFLCCQKLLPDLIERRFGRIILVGSIAGRTVPKIAGPAYGVSKSALSGLLRSLITTLNGTGVTTNLVAPGHISTAMTGSTTSEVNQSALGRIPVGRIGTPEDVAALIVFLASKDAGFINGASIDVNGGEFVSL